MLSSHSRAKTMLRMLGQIALILFVSAFILVERGRTMDDPFFLLPLCAFSGLLVGPVVIESFRKDPRQSATELLIPSVARAVGAVLLILILSLALVNLFFWNGRPALPTFETGVWVIALSITAAVAAAAGLAVALSRLPLDTVRWGFRVIALVVFLVYNELPPAWPISWRGLVADWGLTPVALGWEMLFAAVAWAGVVLLKRREGARGMTGKVEA
jgi:hypothetical protein